MVPLSILISHLEQLKSYIAKQLKLKHCEKASKRQNKWEIFSIFCGLFGIPELYARELLLNSYELFKDAILDSRG
jgi:hypothetical protein